MSTRGLTLNRTRRHLEMFFDHLLQVKSVSNQRTPGNCKIPELFVDRNQFVVRRRSVPLWKFVDNLESGQDLIHHFPVLFVHNLSLNENKKRKLIILRYRR